MESYVKSLVSNSLLYLSDRNGRILLRLEISTFFSLRRRYRYTSITLFISAQSRDVTDGSIERSLNDKFFEDVETRIKNFLRHYILGSVDKSLSFIAIQMRERMIKISLQHRRFELQKVVCHLFSYARRRHCSFHPATRMLA